MRDLSGPDHEDAVLGLEEGGYGVKVDSGFEVAVQEILEDFGLEDE